MNRRRLMVCLVGLLLLPTAACGQTPPAPSSLPVEARILFLHHSTGECIWNGGAPEWFAAYNARHGKRYLIQEQAFPKDSPYGWENFPYDYWNIWVQHAGPRPYQEEPTLEMLTRQYSVIVFKHCFPVSNIEPDEGPGDVASREKRLANYRLQYAALKSKLRQFPTTRFLLWTGAAQVRSDIDEASARRAKTFFDWVRREWDEPGDNIFLWDFYALETEGGLYLKPAYAAGDAHPNESFSRKVAPLFCQRVVDVIEGRGDLGSITGEGAKPVAPPATSTAKTTPPDEKRSPSQTPAPAEKAAPAVVSVDSGKTSWIFDDAEDPTRLSKRWGRSVRYSQIDGQNVLRLDLQAGEQEDWGEYGAHRLIYSRAPAANLDISAFRYLTFRIRAEQPMDVVLTLVTLPKPQGDRYQPHFGFSAYPTIDEGGAWKQIVLDLTQLELQVEGSGAYEAAGSPARPERLTLIKFAVHQKHEKTALLLDDLTFHRELPATLPR